MEATLKNLGVEYLDLYLIHWPIGFQAGEVNMPRKADGSMAYSDTSYLETWPAMEQLVDDGLVKHIGLSNFNSKQIDEVSPAYCVSTHIAVIFIDQCKLPTQLLNSKYSYSSERRTYWSLITLQF